MYKNAFSPSPESDGSSRKTQTTTLVKRVTKVCYWYFFHFPSPFNVKLRRILCSQDCVLVISDYEKRNGVSETFSLLLVQNKFIQIF